MWKVPNDAYINTTKICSVRVPRLLSSNPCLSTSPGLAILLGVTDRLSLSIMAERADFGVERTLTQLLLRSCGDCEKLTEKRRRSFFFPLVLSFIWSCIWVSFSTNSPTLLQFLNGQPSLKAGQLLAKPFHFVTKRTSCRSKWRYKGPSSGKEQNKLRIKKLIHNNFQVKTTFVFSVSTIVQGWSTAGNIIKKR